jgi:mRNA-degrading endonuclease YafQ of YafQ-DinJ toxin-antitoxin module
VELGVINKIAKLIERIDGQIKNEERTMLQRDVLGRFTMTHKGWLSVIYSNRFKKKHLNLQTGQYEEGSYISLMKFFTNTLNSGYTKKGIKGSFSDFKDAYMNADSELVRQNLRRAGIEMSFLSALFLLSLGSSLWADDDDDSLTAQTTAYMLERVVNETSSSQLGIVGEFYKSFKEPIVGLGKIDNLISISDTYNTDLVKSGRYKGVSHQAKYFIKNIPGVKSFFDFYSAKNLQSQRDSYDYFNEEEIFTPIAWVIDEEDLKEEYGNQEQN